MGGDAGAGGEDAPIKGGYEDLRAEAVGFDDFGYGCYLLLWWGAELGCFFFFFFISFIFPFFPLASLPSTTRRSQGPLASRRVQVGTAGQVGALSSPYLPCRVRIGALIRCFLGDAHAGVSCRVQLGAPKTTRRFWVGLDFDVDEEVGVVLRPLAKFFEGGDGYLVELSLVGEALLVVAARAQGADVVAF